MNVIEIILVLGMTITMLICLVSGTHIYCLKKERAKEVKNLKEKLERMEMNWPIQFQEHKEDFYKFKHEIENRLETLMKRIFTDV